MMRMMDLGNQRGPLQIIDTPTSVDCTKDVGFRRSFRSLVECMVPCCGFQPTLHSSDSDSNSTDSVSSVHVGATVTGTFFGHRHGRVSFCLQSNSRSHPLLLLEFTVPTAYLAREMRHGLLRIVLEERGSGYSRSGGSVVLFGVPVWTVYCNGRKVGFAVRRKVGESDVAVLKLIGSVSVGAGVFPTKADLMYLRASFERVIGSADSESFHMINPVGSTGQELSIFLLRS